MRVGSPEYQSKARRFDALKELHFPVFTAEMCQLNSELTVAEMGHDDARSEATLADIVCDYEDAMRYTGDLGQVGL